jgi:hypothetical protein
MHIFLAVRAGAEKPLALALWRAHLIAKKAQRLHLVERANRVPIKLQMVQGLSMSLNWMLQHMV